MKPEIKEKFIAALRSGVYKKATGSLRVGDTFCAMGVLCDLAVKDGVTKWIGYDGPEGSYWTIDDNEACLPDSVAEWADTQNIFYLVGEDGEARSVILWNDGLDGVCNPLPFDEIAAMIDEQL